MNRKKDRFPERSSHGHMPAIILPGILLLLLILHPQTLFPARQQNRIHFLDVGYGDAVVIEMPGHTLLIDAGDPPYGDQIARFLHQKGITQIDTAILTHPHQNHLGGFVTLFRTFPVGRFYRNGDSRAEKPYDELMAWVEKKKIPLHRLQAGDTIPDLPPGVRMEVLHPEQIKGSVNDSSLVLLFEDGSNVFLFTGDVGPDAQEELIKNHREKLLTSDGVQVPHHGGPLHPDFIRLFDQAVFVVSTGPNRWGLPYEDQISQLNGPVYHTDRNGPVHLISGREGLTVSGKTKSPESAP